MGILVFPSAARLTHWMWTGCSPSIGCTSQVATSSPSVLGLSPSLKSPELWETTTTRASELHADNRFWQSDRHIPFLTVGFGVSFAGGITNLIDSDRRPTCKRYKTKYLRAPLLHSRLSSSHCDWFKETQTSQSPPPPPPMAEWWWVQPAHFPALRRSDCVRPLSC